MNIVRLSQIESSEIPADRCCRRGFFWLGALAISALAWLVVLGGCTPPPPEDCLIAGRLGYVAELDSLGLEKFLALGSQEQEQRRELARRWRQRAAGAERMDHRLQSLATAGGLAPDDPEVWLDLADIWRWVGDHLGAVAYLDNAAAAVRNLTADLAAGGDYQDLQDRKRLLARRTAVLRAWVHYDRGEFSKGKSWVEAADRTGAYEPEVMQIKGLTLARLGERSHALEVADDIHRADLFDTDIRWIRGSVELAQGRLKEAFVYQGGLRPDREHAAECYRDMAATAERMRKWSYARRWYDQSEAALPIPHRTCLRKITALVLDPACGQHEMPVWVAFGRHYVTGSLSAFCAHAWDRFENAETAQDRNNWAGAVVDAAGILIRQDIDEVWALRVRGLVFASMEMNERALWDLRLASRKLQEMNLPDARVLAEMGRLHLLDENYELALPHLRKAVAIEDGSAQSWCDLGLALVMTGQAKPAESALTRALELDPSLATAWYNRGLLYLHSNRLTAAADDLQEAARLAPNNLEISSLLQRIHQMQRNSETPRDP